MLSRSLAMLATLTYLASDASAAAAAAVLDFRTYWQTSQLTR